MFIVNMEMTIATQKQNTKKMVDKSKIIVVSADESHSKDMDLEK